jgi:hypothetical protein
MEKEISLLIEELKQLGEDRDELDFWQSIVTELTHNQQKELLDGLTAERDALKGTGQTS